MSTVFGPDNFTVGSNVGIVAYNSADYVYVTGKGGTTDLTVNAANDRVQITAVSLDIIARLCDAAIPTDGTAILTMTQSSGSADDNPANPGCRFKTDNSAEGYVAYINRFGTNNLILYRIDGGSFVSLSTTARTFAASHTVTFKGVTNGSQVDLTCTLDGLADVTYSDTHANRKLNGTPAIHMYANTVNVAWIDNVSVDGGDLYDASMVMPGVFEGLNSAAMIGRSCRGIFG